MNKNYWMDGLNANVLGCIDGIDLDQGLDMEDELGGYLSELAESAGGTRKKASGGLSLSDLNPLKHVASAVDTVVPGAGKFIDPLGNVLNPIVDRAGTVVGLSTGRSTSTSGALANARASMDARRASTAQASTSSRNGGREDVAIVLARALASRDALTGMTRRPRLSAKSVTTGKGAGNAALAAMVANSVAKKLGPEMRAVNKRLRLAANQRTATSEHLTINNKTAFRRKVLQDLMRLSTTLPVQHPTRARIRRVGLMSGLL